LNKHFGNTKEIFSKVNEENQKIKAPKKDYLESDFGTRRAGEDLQIEKPKFTNRTVGDANEPHYVDINKNEDVMVNFI
jgi:hypothetical protein